MEKLVRIRDENYKHGAEVPGNSTDVAQQLVLENLGTA